MAKQLKINIKNTQIAQAISLSQKSASPKKSSDKKSSESKSEKSLTPASIEPAQTPDASMPPRKRARSRSHFGEGQAPSQESVREPATENELEEPSLLETPIQESLPENESSQEPALPQTEAAPLTEPVIQPVLSNPTPAAPPEPVATPPKASSVSKFQTPKPKAEPSVSSSLLTKRDTSFLKGLPVKEKFGPTGKHVKDLLPPKIERPAPKLQPRTGYPPVRGEAGAKPVHDSKTPKPTEAKTPSTDTGLVNKKPARFKEFKDVKPAKKQTSGRFDSRDRQGLRADEDGRWRKRRSHKGDNVDEDTTIRPSNLKIRLPIILKDLAQEMKLKASQLVQKLFLQGVAVTLNDVLEDATTVQLLGHDFGCEITIDTSQEERIRVTDKTAQQEIAETESGILVKRPPVVAFMGHVDHGKTSLIDAIRKTNRASGEAGAITQHIGAFMCQTAVGDLAILDTPGHEAFSEMRKRGANVTDIVVLVVAGDEGIRQQTIEAIQHAKEANVTIVVALNKCDKPNFNAETVYRQLADQDLLPEQWGGQTVCIPCSAVTHQGIPELLEMLALQADVLELKANPEARARGRVIESEMHKGMGPKATVLVINGSLKKGDALVFEQHYGRVKTMHDDLGLDLDVAGPSHPVEITGLSGLPEAGQEFIVVSSEKEAKNIVAMRLEELKAKQAKKKPASLESLMEQGQKTGKKILNLVLRADVQGSLEAIKTALGKIESAKCDLNIIHAGVGEISESDVQLAAASKAMILGFHTQVESHAETLIKVLGIVVKTHDIIYHAVDEVKLCMKGLLDKIAIEKETGKAEVRATFKSSQLGTIAGCQVIEGTIYRNNYIRIRRKNDVVFKGTIASLKKIKEDVREVPKGQECGILISNFSLFEVGDIIETYEINYLTQEL